MKSEKEILDDFGSKLIERVYDDAINYFDQIVSGTTPWGVGKEYTDIFKKLSKEDHVLLRRYIKETIGTSLFAVLGIFEENPEFKIKYIGEGKEMDLVAISEMLKAEPTIENGWIDRFSKKLRYNELT
ncbi:hypothetical protein [Algibacter sp. 2305UL17-15]|uniref:hypothetical protein n=1 Tax=Algibacter sp. 2305UL17-15 TaxID=3231268 RepID=UPI003459BAC7